MPQEILTGHKIATDSQMNVRLYNVTHKLAYIRKCKLISLITMWQEITREDWHKIRHNNQRHKST